MTLREQFGEVEIMFENQIGSLNYDELCEATTECEIIADEFAIGFAEWYLKVSEKYDNHLILKKDSKQLLEVYKKEKLL